MKKSTLFHFKVKQWEKNNSFYLLFLLCMSLFSGWESRAQASSYMFAADSSPYEETSASATTLPTLLADTAISGVLEIGFDFVYEGITYTQFRASSNGFISFNTAAEALTSNNFSTANATSRPIIAPLWDDLDGRATGGSIAAYEVTGTSPNQVLTVEWRNWEWNYNSVTPVMSFQVKLYETTNVIEFSYRQESGNVNNGSASIGIGSATGSGVGSFLNITSLQNLTVSSATSTTDIATKPLTDQVFRFTPPTCLMPSQLAAENFTPESADLSWVSDGALFDLEWGAVGFQPEGGNGNMEYGITSTSITISELDQATSYHFYVRQNCGNGDLSNWAGPFLFKTTQITATLPYSEDFENPGSGWEFVNGTQANKWVIGNGAHAGAENAMYISNNNDLSYNYTLSGTQVSHAFRNIEIPSGTDTIDLSFDWKAKGEGFTGTFYDYISVWVVPVGFTPTAGNEITTGDNRIQVGGKLNNIEEFTTVNHVVDVSGFTDGEARLVFTWRNDSGGGTQPPGAIDNVSISVTSCVPPTALAVNGLDNDSAILSWTSDGALFDVAWGAVGFTPGVDEEGIAQSVPVPYTLENLDTATNYQYYVRQNCGDNTSIWVGPLTFTTLQVVATLPYSFDFETEPHNWTLSNGNQANKWVVGTAAHDGAENALYISNDNGITNGYAHTLSVVHAFRELEIPDGTTDVDLSFDWKAQGEGCCDYIRVWIVPITFMPTTGTQIVAANGKQVGANFNLSASFGTANFVVDLTAYAGQTVRLVFEWRNDGGGGTAPAGAIDNVSISQTSCSPVTDLDAINITQSSADLTWTSDGNSFDVEWGAAGFVQGEGIMENDVNGALFELTSLEADTAYQYYVRQDCGSSQSIWTGPYSFYTGYCLPTGSTERYITNFTTSLAYENINNTTTSSPGGYGDYSSMSCSQSEGETVNVSITPTAGTHYFYVWVDWNNDFDFNDEGETLVATTNYASSYTGSFTVPADQPLGAYRMRVANSWSGVITPCGPSANGEYEDYTLMVVAPPSCPAPTTLMVENITGVSAEVSWESDGSVFDIEYGPIGFELGTGSLIEGVTNYHTLENLDPTTNYQYYVRQDCGGNDVSFWSQPLSFRTTQILAVLPYNENFEDDDHSWEFNNGTHVNRWYVGDAVNNGGDRAMYISNDNGVTNAYTTSTSVTHAFRDVKIPDNAQNIALSFDWRCVGEGFGPVNYYDYLRVWVVPSTFTPANGTQISTTNSPGAIQIGGYFNGSDSFVQANFTLDASAYEGQVVRLVFEFRSDVNGGVQPPAAIDNISIIEANCLQPSALNAQEITASSAELSWTSDGAAFDVQWGPDGFVIGTGTMETAVSNPYTLDGLNDAIAYQFYVRQNCGADDASIWAGPFSFMTSQVPVDLPYSENFETSEHGWSLQNGNQINKWYVGDAISGTNALYISNDGGLTNTYATGSTSLTHAYRSIEIPEGTQELTVSFDWRAVGDATDYLKAWIVPESLAIVPGAQIATGTGNIPVGEIMNSSADFTTAEHTINVAALAGQTARLVFEWRNDYLGGVQTPAAIDNVSIELGDLGVTNPNHNLFSYYPNPVSDVLNFSNNSTITSVTVFNILGQQMIVKDINATSGQIDMSNLASGNYIVKVQTDGLTKTIKIVKQ